jgi:hypothetical protein
MDDQAREGDPTRGALRRNRHPLPLEVGLVRALLKRRCIFAARVVTLLTTGLSQNTLCT